MKSYHAIVFFFFFLSVSSSYSQSVDSTKQQNILNTYQKSITGFWYPYFKVVKLQGDSSLALLYCQRGGGRKKRKCSINILDTALSSVYEEKINIPKGYFYINSITKDNKFYILVGKQYFYSMRFSKFAVIEFDTETKTQKLLYGKFKRPFVLFQMVHSNGKLLIFGEGTLKLRKEAFRFTITYLFAGIPILFGSLNFPQWTYTASVDFNTSSVESKEIKYSKKPHLSMVGVNVNDEKSEAYILLKDRKNMLHITQYLQTVNYTDKLKLSSKVLLNIGKGKKKEVMDAKVNPIATSGLVIVGQYSNVLSLKINAGIYVAKIEKNRVEWSKTFTYAEIVKKIKTGRDSISNSAGSAFYDKQSMNILFHNMVEMKDEYVFIGEGYIETYTSQRVSDGRGGYYYVPVFDGYYYEKCLAFAVSKQGELKWSSWFNLPYYKFMIKPEKPILNLKIQTDTILLTGFVSRELITHAISKNGFIEKDIEAKVWAKTDFDSTKFYQVLNFIPWYGNYSLVYNVEWKKHKKDEHSQKKHWHKNILLHKTKD